MLVRVQAENDAPLYEQIASQLRRAIMEGKLQAGERLPPAREFAQSLNVHMHTVLRAYDELRQERLLEVRPGRGVVVLGRGPGRTQLLELGRAYLAEGKKQGLKLDELRKLLGEL
jgi:GntR family transcriptional regulator